jgi:hypothetical protein
MQNMFYKDLIKSAHNDLKHKDKVTERQINRKIQTQKNRRTKKKDKQTISRRKDKKCKMCFMKKSAHSMISNRQTNRHKHKQTNRKEDKRTKHNKPKIFKKCFMKKSAHSMISVWVNIFALII